MPRCRKRNPRPMRRPRSRRIRKREMARGRRLPRTPSKGTPRSHRAKKRLMSSLSIPPTPFRTNLLRRATWTRPRKRLRRKLRQRTLPRTRPLRTTMLRRRSRRPSRIRRRTRRRSTSPTPRMRPTTQMRTPATPSWTSWAQSRSSRPPPMRARARLAFRSRLRRPRLTARAPSRSRRLRPLRPRLVCPIRPPTPRPESGLAEADSALGAEPESPPAVDGPVSQPVELIDVPSAAAVPAGSNSDDPWLRPLQIALGIVAFAAAAISVWLRRRTPSF